MAISQNLKMALIQKIAPTMRFLKMLANCQILVFSNTLKKVSRCVADIICIAQITYKMINDALFIILYVICAMQIMSATQRVIFFNVLLNTRIRQLASILKHFHEAHGRSDLLNESHFKILRKCQGKFDCLVFEMLYIKKFKPNLNVQTDSIRAKLFV